VHILRLCETTCLHFGRDTFLELCIGQHQIQKSEKMNPLKLNSKQQTEKNVNNIYSSSVSGIPDA
jgi:hypothetical protein